MKFCKHCGENAEFYDSLPSRCKKCYSKYRKEYTKKYRESGRALESARRLRKIRQEKTLEYLSNHPCVDCGYNDNPAPLQFDHVRGEKELDVGDIIRRYSWKKALVEIEKCEVRCANCHAIRTAKVQNWYTKDW